jgi:hypothetical protein
MQYLQMLFNWIDNLSVYRVLAFSNFILVGLLGISWSKNQRLQKKIEILLYIESSRRKEDKKDA